MPQVLLLLLSLLHLKHLFNKQGLKPRQTRLSTRAQATLACDGFFSVTWIVLKVLAALNFFERQDDIENDSICYQLYHPAIQNKENAEGGE